MREHWGKVLQACLKRCVRMKLACGPGSHKLVDATERNMLQPHSTTEYVRSHGGIHRSSFITADPSPLHAWWSFFCNPRQTRVSSMVMQYVAHVKKSLSQNINSHFFF